MMSKNITNIFIIKIQSLSSTKKLATSLFLSSWKKKKEKKAEVILNILK